MTNHLLQRLAVVYGQPDSPDPKAYLAEVAKLMSKYRDSTLDAAADLILKTHRGYRWPTPAQCVTACEDVLAEEAGRQPFSVAPAYPDWTPEAIAHADALIQCDMGRRAAKEGWITQLHDLCRKKRRLPNENEIRGLITEARLFEEAYAQVEAGNGGTLQAALLKLGRAMMAKRVRLGEVANGFSGSITDRSRAMQGDREEYDP